MLAVVFEQQRRQRVLAGSFFPPFLSLQVHIQTLAAARESRSIRYRNIFRAAVLQRFRFSAILRDTLKHRTGSSHAGPRLATPLCLSSNLSTGTSVHSLQQSAQARRALVKLGRRWSRVASPQHPNLIVAPSLFSSILSFVSSSCEALCPVSSLRETFSCECVTLALSLASVIILLLPLFSKPD